jgi:hypothetical protein
VDADGSPKHYADVANIETARVVLRALHAAGHVDAYGYHIHTLEPLSSWPGHAHVPATPKMADWYMS